MMKFVKVILFLLLSVAFYGIADNSSVTKTEQELYGVTVMDSERDSVVAISQLPCLPEAEIVGSSSLIYHVMSRVQRVNLLEYSLSLRFVLQSLANRQASLSQHWKRIYDTTTSYCCHPSNQYYVFALRKIII